MDFQMPLLDGQFRAAQHADEFARLNSLRERVRSEEDAKQLDKASLKEACQQFEAVFLRELLKDMRKLSEAFTGGNKMLGTHVYWDIMDSSFAEALAASDTLGIGRFVYEQLIKQIEGQQAEQEGATGP